MIGRRPRSLSQRNYQLLQEIRNNAMRLRQLDQGLSYRRHVDARDLAGAERPLHVGSQIEALPVGNDRWSA